MNKELSCACLIKVVWCPIVMACCLGLLLAWP